MKKDGKNENEVLGTEVSDIKKRRDELFAEAEMLRKLIPPNCLDSQGLPHTGAVVDSLEECNFRLAAFARAYLGKDHDLPAVIARARILYKHLSDFVLLLQLYCNHHESLKE